MSGKAPLPPAAPDEACDEIEQRMRAYAALAFALSADLGVDELAARVLPILQDDVCGLALYAASPDDPVTKLRSHAGLPCPPPFDALAGRVQFPEHGSIVKGSAHTQVILFAHGTAPAWLGANCRCAVTVHFSASPAHAARGFVLFAVHTPAPSSACEALLRLVAQRIGDCFARRADEDVHRNGPEHAAGSVKVLLIDDEPMMMSHVARHLRRRGFDFHGAESAREGLEMAALVQPDVLLVDKRLPDMDGIEVLRTVRRNARLSTVPVIMLSGFGDEATRIRALQAGADDFVVKPFSMRELVARIQSNVRMAQARRAAVWRESEVLRLRQSQQELRKLIDTIQNVRADERRLLAREVHDQLGQLLTAAKIDICLLEDRSSAEPGQPADELLRELRSARSSIDLAIASVQNISILLRPPALEHGLIAALRWQAEDLERRTKMTCTLIHNGEDYVEPSQFVAGELFRICQEALTNVVRHAKATRVLIHVTVRDRRLLLRICDNGVGISRDQSTKPNAIGIAGMRERAASISATFHVHGSPKRGTIVAIKRRLALP